MENKITKNNKGFSLVELIVVIAIMAVLMGVLAPTLIGNIEKSRESTDLQNLDAIRGAAVTVMSEEAAYNEIMAEMGKNTSLKIDLGASATAKASNITLSGGGTAFKDALVKTLASDIEMKSANALKSGNKVYIEITADGVVSAYVADDSGKVAECKKTEDASGAKRKLISK